jgi:hypothetical protein
MTLDNFQNETHFIINKWFADFSVSCFLYGLFIGLSILYLRCNCTVSRRVVINPRSDSSESCFHVLNPKVNSLAKKKSQQETPCYLPLFWYGPSKWKLWEKSWIFLAAEGSILEPNISGSVRNLFGVYILVRKVFKSAFCPQL